MIERQKKKDKKLLTIQLIKILVIFTCKFLEISASGWLCCLQKVICDKIFAGKVSGGLATSQSCY